MPIVGEPSRFAVEYVFDDDIYGAWMFGDICYWCAGLRVGDYGIGTSLRDVLFQLDGVAQYSHQRENPRFQGVAAAGLLQLLNWALYSFGPETREHSSHVPNHAPEDEQWLRHLIYPRVDIFDNWRVFLVENAQVARLVFSKYPYDEVGEVILKIGEVDSVLDEVRSVLNEVHERERSKEA